ncbi:MAG: hypothetical protein QW666_01210 [Candidatus Woesearchaeota archaeon]
MKTYYLSDLEKIFSFKSLSEVSLEFVSNAYDGWEKRLEDAYIQGWITAQAYSKSLSKIRSMANYLMYLAREAERKKK